MKKFLLSACCMVALNLFAQIATDEQPYGLREGFRAQPQDRVVLLPPDMSHIEKEDLDAEQNQGPVRYAIAVPASFTPENSGVWHQMEDGSKIWRLKVKLPGALATVTAYDRFWLPDGGKFFVYSEETRQSIGAIISEFIEGDQVKPIEFATALIYGENVVYEYVQPSAVKEHPIISIKDIGYAYRYVENSYSKDGTRSVGSSGPCQVNINCQEGANWQTEKRAVTRISIQLGEDFFWCSGALINNTANNFTPYVLTAD